MNKPTKSRALLQNKLPLHNRDVDQAEVDEPDQEWQDPGLSYKAARNPQAALKPVDVLRLQQAVGNQAVQRLLAQRNKPAPSQVQREIMSPNEFQKLTNITGARR